MKTVLGTGLVSGALLAANSQAELVDGEELIDPTAPFLLEVESAEPVTNLFATLNSYELNSILIRDDFRVAVINSKRVKEGELIGSARVVSIERGKVTLDLDGEERVLNLHGAPIKTRSK